MPWLVIHVHAVDLGQTCVANSGRHGNQLIARFVARCGALLTVVPTLKRRCGRAQNDPSAFHTAAVDGQIAGRIARTLLLLVAHVVLFIDDDDFQTRYGGKNRHARAQDHFGFAKVGGKPTAQPLRWGEAAVQTHNAVLAPKGHKALLHPSLELRREVDLGHHDEGLCTRVALKEGLDGPQVDLGFTAAGAAKQQKRPSMGFNV